MNTIVADTVAADVDREVRQALAEGRYRLTERDTYRQHCLREHPNVCRQSERHTAVYVLHDEPCGCPPDHAPKPDQAPQGVCCYIRQAAEAECMMCGEVVAANL